MAKEAKAVETTEVAPQPTVEKKQAVKIKPTAPEWEIKDRTYYLIGKRNPLTHIIPSKHSRRYPLLWFDEKQGKQRELRYATNQSSPLVDEQKGESTMAHIIFKEGTLFVPKQKQNLQKLLSLYHPMKGRIYDEFDKVSEAKDEIVELEMQIEALNAAREMSVDQAEAILRVELGSKVTEMSSKEIKRDLLLFAKKDPNLFIELATDENVHLRNIAIVATENRIIKLSDDNRTFSWASNNRKLMTVPFDENPYSAMAAYFKTDEGTEVLRSIEKKLQ